MKKKKKDKILEEEFFKLGKHAGRIGGALGGMPGQARGTPGGKISSAVLGRDRGARRGASAIVALLPTETKEHNLFVSKNLNEVKSIVRSFLRIKEIETKNGITVITGVMGSGFLNMNPSVIVISLRSVSQYKTEVHIKAGAKEGLIKQNTAGKAIDKIKGLFSEEI